MKVYSGHILFMHNLLNKFEILEPEIKPSTFPLNMRMILYCKFIAKIVSVEFYFDTGAEHTLLLKKEYADVLV